MNESLIRLLFDKWERKTLLDFLRLEISRFETTAQKPGWTMWALFAAEATLISYFFFAVDQKLPDWKVVGVLFVFLSVGLVCSRLFVGLFKVIDKSSETQCRFTFANADSDHSRLEMIVMLAYIVIVYVIYRSVPFGLGYLSSKFLEVFILAAIIVLVIGVVASFFPLPILKSNTSKTVLVFVAVFVGIGTVACVDILVKNSHLASVHDWQVASALVAISCGVIFLSRLHQAPTFIGELKYIERRLVFDQLTVDEAKDKVDRILYGMTLGHLMEPHVRRALQDLDAFESKVKELVKQLEVLRDAIDDTREEEDEELTTKLKMLVVGVRSTFGEVKNLRKRASHSCEKLLNKMSMYAKRVPDISTEVNALLERIKPAIRQAKKTTEEAEKSVNEICEPG
jgi:hypothetical protein